MTTHDQPAAIFCRPKHHVWTRDESGKVPWPYDGQPCICGAVVFKKGVGAVKP